nr:MAG TPA: hypothetical protein [Caudoviricetes sp.]
MYHKMLKINIKHIHHMDEKKIVIHMKEKLILFLSLRFRKSFR